MTAFHRLLFPVQIHRVSAKLVKKQLDTQSVTADTKRLPGTWVRGTAPCPGVQPENGQLEQGMWFSSESRQDTDIEAPQP